MLLRILAAIPTPRQLLLSLGNSPGNAEFANILKLEAGLKARSGEKLRGTPQSLMGRRWGTWLQEITVHVGR